MSFCRWPAAAAKVLAETPSAPDRAAALADELLACLPGAVLAACRLNDGGEAAFGLAKDGPGKDTAGGLRRRLENLTFSAEELTCLLEGDGTGTTLLAAGLLDRRGTQLGLLALGLPRDGNAAQQEAFRGLLEAAALTLAGHLEREVLANEVEELAEVATLGDAVAGLVHDLNNALNTMVLQAATVQMRVEDTDLREAVGGIRKEGAKAAGLLRPLQAFRERRRKNVEAVGLGEVVQEILAEVARPGSQRGVAGHSSDGRAP